MASRRVGALEMSLVELFLGPGGHGMPVSTPPVITLGTLALSLNVPAARLVPLVEEGWLVATVDLNGAPPTMQTPLQSPPQPALLWLRQWFQPARAKVLFSRADVAELTGLTEKAVTRLAARCRIPVSYEPALSGLVFSAWAVKRLMLAEAGGSGEATTQRYDRQALLWMLLEKDPKRALAPPDFSDALEDELARVARLPEPARTLRATALWEQWQDVKLLAQGVAGSEASQASQASQARVQQKLAKADLKFSHLRPRS